jgi:transposase
VDAEAVVDLGVVAFAQETGVLQAGFPAQGPGDQMMDVELARVSRTPSQWRDRHGRGVFVGRIYTQEFRDQIVALHVRDGRTFGEIATEFGLSATSVAKWVREAEKRDKPRRAADEGQVPDRTADAARIARLERELAQKTEEVEILGKALAFFARRLER